MAKSIAETITEGYLEGRPDLRDKLQEKIIAARTVEGRAGVLDYSATRPEITNLTIQDGPAPSRGKAVDRPEGEPLLEYPNRPEIAGPSRLEGMTARNGKKLAELRELYLQDMADYRAGKIVTRPYWAPQLAVDLREEIDRTGIYAAMDCPRESQ
jgi:hypothetical protein